jgi:serine/threonine-protein kinase RsbW
MTLNRRVNLTMPADAEFIDLIRLNLYGVASKMGFSYEEIDDMKVAVSEACNNVVLHAYSDHEIGTIHISMVMLDNGIRIEIKDDGNSFDHAQARYETSSLHGKSLDEVNPGGLGIYLMEALMDKVEMSNQQGTQVTLTKFLNSKRGENAHESESQIIF